VHAVTVILTSRFLDISLNSSFMSSAMCQAPMTSTANSNGQEDQDGESQNLVVHGSNIRGNPNVLGPEPATSSSSSSRNSFPDVSQGPSSTTTRLESETQARTDTTVDSPSLSASSENDPWIGKFLLTLGESLYHW